MVEMTDRIPEPSWLKKESVYELAEDVARQLDYRPGTDLRPIVEKLGGRLEYKDFWRDPSDSGSMDVWGESNFCIYLSTDTSEIRDRFTIAHELGHYVVHFLWPRHHKGRDIEAMTAGRYGSDRIEWEANWFAAAFLMPEKEFRAKMDEFGGDLISVADYFAVSVSAAEVRAKALNLGHERI